jgi:hypothetical protein
MLTRRGLITGASAAAIAAGIGGAEGLEFNSPQGRALLGGAVNPFVNINAATTANFKAAYLANTASIPIAFNGDSAMRGVDETASPYNSQYPNSGAQVLADLLQANSINGGSDNWYGHSGTSLADYVNRDSRVAATGGTIIGSVQCQGGASINFPAVASTWSYTSRKPCTDIDVYWRDTGAGVNMTVTIDGGAVTPINSSGTFQFAKTSYTGLTLGIHTIVLSWSSCISMAM